MKRTHTCGELRPDHVGQTVTLAGWVQNRRDHGSLMFIDLRDRYGLTQIVFDLEKADVLKLGQEVRAEWVLQVTGTVEPRPEDMVNPKLPTGGVEVRIDTFQVFSRSEPIPFETDEYAKVGEEVRMTYRYLDLRRPQMQRHLAVRHAAIQAMRRVMDSEGFLEIETPILGKSTPEGARDYLVPSRVHPGNFYALPQSPQLYKQILMVGGCDRYYQIARCFRDEDLRADRQPEFTQLDLEMSFADMDDVFTVVEKAMAAAFEAGIGAEVPIPFPRMPYSEAMARFGTDKPDLRFDLELADVTDLAGGCGFTVFRSVVEKGGAVKGLAVPGGATMTRKELDKELLDVVTVWGAKGLAWMKRQDGAFTGAPVKFFEEGELAALAERTGCGEGDVMLFVAAEARVTNAALAALRNELGRRLKLTEGKPFAFSWITEFPLFEWDPELKRWDSAHNIVTMVHEDDLRVVTETEDLGPESPLGTVRSTSYDLVLNGVEVASGSVRIHDSDLQAKIFRILGISEEDAKRRFGFFLRALQYGTPPHAGIAPGLDRIVAMMLGQENIREVIAFPKTARAVDLMSEAPTPVDEKQLKELALRVR